MKDSQFWEGTAQVRAIPLKYPCKVMKEWEFFWAGGDYQCSQRLCFVEAVWVCEEKLSTDSKMQSSQHNMTVSGKHTKGGHKMSVQKMLIF